MSKPQFQDIIPPDRRSIKKIPIPDRAQEARGGIYEPHHERTSTQTRPQPQPQAEPRYQPKPSVSQQHYEPAQKYQPTQEPQPHYNYVREEDEIPVPRPKPTTQPRRKSKLPTIIVIVLLLVLVGGLVYFFLPQASGASITIIPKGQNATVDSTFTASSDAGSDLPYQVAVYEKDGKLTVPGGAEETAQVKASGVIRIFNNYSTSPQLLIANTRFETPTGKIFRIKDAVTVPGKTGSTPGSIDVTITADQVGVDYNVGLTDFTIPGFKGDPRYEQIFARSKDTIGGGFAGTRKKVDESQVTAARQKIREELKSSLANQMQQNIPENYLSPKDAYFITYESLPNTSVDNGVQLTERATFHGIMFKRSDLARAINKVQNVGNTDQYSDFASTDSLAFLAKAGTSTKPWESQTLTFSLNGTTTLISAIDIDKLKGELVGKPRKSLNAILAGYTGVAKAEVIMRPFWKQSFPTNKSDIDIKVSSEPAQ